MTPVIYKILYNSILLSTMVSIITGIWCVYDMDSLTRILYKEVSKLFFGITIISGTALGLIKLLTST